MELTTKELDIILCLFSAVDSEWGINDSEETELWQKLDREKQRLGNEPIKHSHQIELPTTIIFPKEESQKSALFETLVLASISLGFWAMVGVLLMKF